MKFRLITDSRDALTGMRLAGIEGVYADTAESAERELKACVDDKDTGIILVTENIASACTELIDSMKLGESGTLVVTVPGSKNEQSGDNIMRYVREAIGIKI